MTSNLPKILKVLLIVLMAISVVILVIFAKATSNMPVEFDTEFDKQIEVYGGILDMFIYWTYILLGIATAAAVIFPIIKLATNPKDAIKSLVSIVAIAVFVFVAYKLSDGSILNLPGYTGKDNVEGTLKFADTIIFTMYFLLGGAILSIVYAEVTKALK